MDDVAALQTQSRTRPDPVSAHRAIRIAVDCPTLAPVHTLHTHTNTKQRGAQCEQGSTCQDPLCRPSHPPPFATVALTHTNHHASGNTSSPCVTYTPTRIPYLNPLCLCVCAALPRPQHFHPLSYESGRPFHCKSFSFDAVKRVHTRKHTHSSYRQALLFVDNATAAVATRQDLAAAARRLFGALFASAHELQGGRGRHLQRSQQHSNKGWPRSVMLVSCRYKFFCFCSGHNCNNSACAVKQ